MAKMSNNNIFCLKNEHKKVNINIQQRLTMLKNKHTHAAILRVKTQKPHHPNARASTIINHNYFLIKIHFYSFIYFLPTLLIPTFESTSFGMSRKNNMLWMGSFKYEYMWSSKAFPRWGYSHKKFIFLSCNCCLTTYRMCNCNERANECGSGLMEEKNSIQINVHEKL